MSFNRTPKTPGKFHLGYVGQGDKIRTSGTIQGEARQLRGGGGDDDDDDDGNHASPKSTLPKESTIVLTTGTIELI